MSSVFLAFVSSPDVIAKMFGAGLGAAILIISLEGYLVEGVDGRGGEPEPAPAQA
jgi:hypothetical protein